MNSDTLVLIPARFQSARFPGKPLASVGNMPMVQRVFNLCRKSGYATYVVTDNKEIEDLVNSFSGNVIRVDDDVASGTERIALALSREFSSQKQFKYIVNVQGDEPLLEPETIVSLVEFHRKSTFDVTTLVRAEKDKILKNDPNKVKVVFCPETGGCLYFSRSPVPYERSEPKPAYWHHHIGVYCYTAESLLKFVSYRPHPLELLEGLEQLRGLAAGLKYGAIEILEKTFGVDTPEDVKKVEEILSEKTN